MPALDRCEPQIIRALEKQNWLVTDKPFPIRLGQNKGYLYADLRLEHSERNQQVVIVEVKCFPKQRSQLDEFYHAIGQYQVYQNALIMREISLPLYLAIPHDVYEDFFDKDIIQATLQKIQVKLIVIDLRLEEVVKWID
jgi:hypothetical protein